MTAPTPVIPVIRVAQKIRDTYVRMLDSESVRLYVWPFFIALLVWGIYATLWAWPSSIVEPVMGRTVYVLWTWMHIPGTLFVLVGLIMRHGGKPIDEMSSALLFSDYLGLFMQRGGYTCVGILLLMYEVSIIAGGYWGQPLYSFFALAPYVLACAFLAHQTHRKIRHGHRLHEESKE